MPMSEALYISLYFNKTLSHKSSEQSSLVSGPGLNSSPPEAKNPFHLSIECNKDIHSEMLAACERQEKLLMATWDGVCVCLHMCFFY